MKVRDRISGISRWEIQRRETRPYKSVLISVWRSPDSDTSMIYFYSLYADTKCVGFSLTSTNFLTLRTPTGCPSIQSNSDTRCQRECRPAG